MRLLYYLILFLCCFSNTTLAQMITTVGGTGIFGYNGDGGIATSAQFSFGIKITVDGSGNIYLADMDNHRIRKIDVNTRIISTIVGNGIPGFSGDGGLASSAQITQPIECAFDSNGNLYILEGFRIRRVDATTGIITTIAGTGTSGNTGDGGLATSANINYSGGLAIDASGNLYFSTPSSIRKVNISTNIITTVAGNGTVGFSGDGGPAISAQFNNVIDLDIDNNGNLFILDNLNSRVRKVDAAGIISTVAGNGVRLVYAGDGGIATSASLYNPIGISVDANNNFYIGDNYHIRQVNTATGIISSVAGTGSMNFSGDGGPATSAGVYGGSTDFDNNGNMYVPDGPRIRKVFSCFQTSSYSMNAQSLCLNATAQPITFTVTGTGSINYQWYSNTVSSNYGGTLISGATSTSYTPPTSTPGIKYYYVTVTGTCGTYISPPSLAITVNSSTSITTQPSASGQTLCLNATATPLAVTASGASLAYQWYKNTINSNSGGTLISGATSSNYTPPTLTIGTSYYYVRVMACNIVTSLVSGAIVVNSTTVINTQPSTTPQSVCLNGSTTALSVSASGTGVITYQWYSNIINSYSGGTLIPNATSPTYSAPTLAPSVNYYYAVVAGACGVSTSNMSGAVTVISSTISFFSHPAISISPVCQNGVIDPLSVSASGSGTLSYQWYRNSTSSNTNGTLISGATASSYIPLTSSPGTTYYYVGVSETCGSASSNTSGAITINTTPAVSVPSSSLCVGSTMTLSPTSGGTWVSSNPSLATVTNAGVVTGAASGSVTFTFTNTTTTCSNTTSTVTVNEVPTIVRQPNSSNRLACLNSAIPPLAIAATGSNLMYQWYENTISSNSGGTPINGANSSSYTPLTTSSGTLYYYVVVSGQCGNITSGVSGSISVRDTGGSLTKSGDICIGPVQLIAGAGSNYFWSTQIGGISQTGNPIDVSQQEIYTTHYTDIYGSSVCASINVPGCNNNGRVAADDETVSNNPLKGNAMIEALVSELTVSPNPANKTVLIQVPVIMKENAPIFLCSAQGTIHKVGEIKKDEWKSSVSIGEFPPGIYIIRVGSSTLKASSAKLLVIH
jgi:hypothetical protein